MQVPPSTYTPVASNHMWLTLIRFLILLPLYPAGGPKMVIQPNILKLFSYLAGEPLPTGQYKFKPKPGASSPLFWEKLKQMDMLLSQCGGDHHPPRQGVRCHANSTFEPPRHIIDLVSKH